jgi:hypothetical protein
MHWKADPVGTTWRLGGRPTIISPVVTCKSKHGFGLCRHKSMNLVVRPHTISIQLQYPVHFGIRPKTFASSSGCSKCCLPTQLAHLSQYYWEVPLSSDKNARHSSWDKPPCPSCTSRDFSLSTKGRGFQQALSIDVLALINRPHVPATQLREQASITDELPLVYVFLLNNL